MAHLYPHQVYRLSRLWKDNDRRPWLLVADFAEIEGRIECVGMELRSYARTREPKPQPLRGDYDAYWTGEALAPPAGPIDLDAQVRLMRHGLPLEGVALHDPLAAEAQVDLQEAVPLQGPHVLSATTLRDLPFARELARMRRELAALRDRSGLPTVDTLMRRASAAEKKVLRERQQRAQDARDAFAAPTPRPGRPAKYDHSTLERIARIYTEVYLDGSRSPTLDVWKKLRAETDMPYTMAAKLVMKCRRIGLLKRPSRVVRVGSSRAAVPTSQTNGTRHEFASGNTVRGSIRHRGDERAGSWEYIADVGMAAAQRCQDCNKRFWIARRPLRKLPKVWRQPARDRGTPPRDQGRLRHPEGMPAAMNKLLVAVEQQTYRRRPRRPCAST